LSYEKNSRVSAHRASTSMSRRALRDSERASTRSRRSRPTSSQRRKRRSPVTAVSRLGLVGALAGITIVIPTKGEILPDGIFPEEQVSSFANPTSLADTKAASLSGPSTFEVLSQDVDQVGDGIALTEEDVRSRELVVASRNAEREDADDCDPSGPFQEGSNGALPQSQLCTLWDGNHQLRADAAVAFDDLNEGFRARFNRNLCLTDSYRTFASQQTLKSQKGFLAATPGKSEHGWGLAVDLCGNESRSGTVEWNWLNENGGIYGWHNPDWARSIKFEPWHWEFNAD